ncbi:MAG: dicarboxylate/amino acid:cation symporter [Bacteroidaceae bacterium]|nr:dicarboxylate/amino acid:cation symporter [Bacteroidaceae bacterium]
MSKNTNTKTNQGRQLAVWVGALAVGGILGWLHVEWLDGLFHFIATVFTRLFQLVAVPTIALAVITTLSSLGQRQETGRIFLHTLTYTLLTTVAAAVVGLVLYVVISPENIDAFPTEEDWSGSVKELSYYDHLLSVVPNNVVEPFAKGNVLSILLIAAAVGLALAFMPKSDNVQVLIKGIFGLQELLFVLIRALIRVLPLGIVAFAGQLSGQLSAGVMVGSLGKYVAVILGGNLLQFFVVLPLFLLARGLNSWKVLKAMSPAVLMALFTKSSAATLPVTMQSAEERLGVRGEVARFVLPICTTINMNGCAAFILVTSLYVMQNGGMRLDWPTMLVWLVVAVVSAIGNAGVPMGCYFLTFSLMAGVGAPLGIMGLILPLFAVIDMVETAENVWSDSCVCAMVASCPPQDGRA